MRFSLDHHDEITEMLKEYGKTFSKGVDYTVRIVDDIGRLNKAIKEGIFGRFLLRDSYLKTNQILF